jgi:hypothetical protein
VYKVKLLSRSGCCGGCRGEFQCFVLAVDSDFVWRFLVAGLAGIFRVVWWKFWAEVFMRGRGLVDIF